MKLLVRIGALYFASLLIFIKILDLLLWLIPRSDRRQKAWPQYVADDKLWVFSITLAVFPAASNERQFVTSCWILQC
jgi:hypothetical protein